MSDIAKNAKAEAKAAKARAKALRPWYRKKRVIFPAVVVILIIISAAANSGKKNSPSATGGQTTTTKAATGAQTTTTKAAAGAQVTATTVAAGGGSSLPKFGALVKDGDFSFTPSQLVCNIMSVGSSSNFNLTTPTGQFCRITINIYNHSATTQMVDVTSQYAVDSKGRQYPGDSTADSSGNPNLNSGLGLDTMTLNPGLSVSGYLYFDMPKGDTPHYFIFHDSAFSGGVKEQA